MILKAPKTNIDFPKMEEDILSFWEEKKIFEKSVDEKDKPFAFYDGPPFATGLPHYGHLLAGTIKDVIPRYQSMKGFRVKRRFGWDCHGLPVEFEIEKDLELKGRKDIIQYGVGRFNEACRSIVLRYTNEWKQTVSRMGRWIDFENDYKTMDLSFMESVWHVFKTLHEKGLIYEDKKVLPYSTRIASPLSNFEANLNYQNVQDPSITVAFKLKDQSHLLVWTTTPWTLPANLAVAAHPDFTYVKVKHQQKHYILLKSLLDSHFKEGQYEVEETFLGSKLKGLEYEPIIEAFEGKRPSHAFKVVMGTFVTSDSGTGLVHMAPAFGEDDFQVGKENKLEPLDHLDEQAIITNACPLFEGKYFKDADKEIIAYLKSKQLLFKHETLTHSYPFCYRTDTPLIYRAVSTWFLKVSSIKDQLIQNNQHIHWVPEHIKDGRFGKWLENVKDWAISRNRFWGNPIPIWRNEKTSETLCVGSKEELEKLSGQKITDLHKHFVDDIKIKSPHTGDVLTRVPHVLDCWFESGSMPFAQNHYPFEMDDKELSKVFPADFIAEGLDQTRGWFYTLLVISTALDKGPAFKNVVVNGIVLASDGKKMSKRLKNYPEPTEVINDVGADALRMYLLQSAAVSGEDLRFSNEGLKETFRKTILPIYNAYVFLSTYGAIDGFDPEKNMIQNSPNEMDQWLKIKLKNLCFQIESEMKLYHLSKAVAPILTFIDDLNNWYIRRSRRRFWKSENSQDKMHAFSTLTWVLSDLIKLLAPFAPFVSERLYQELMPKRESVHLEDYPSYEALSEKDRQLEQKIDFARLVCNLGRELREQIKIKVRQPLSKLDIGLIDADQAKNLESMVSIIQEELNVKEINFVSCNNLALWQIKPNFQILGKRLGADMKAFQNHVANMDQESIQAAHQVGQLTWRDQVFLLGDWSVELKPKSHIKNLKHSGSVMIALDDTLTSELIDEGLARELINRLQQFRKDSQLNVDDRIDLAFENESSELKKAIQIHTSIIESETLSKIKDSLAAKFEREEKIDQHQIKIKMSKA